MVRRNGRRCEENRSTIILGVGNGEGDFGGERGWFQGGKERSVVERKLDGGEGEEDARRASGGERGR